jgi:hypothetical protein
MNGLKYYLSTLVSSQKNIIIIILIVSALFAKFIGTTGWSGFDISPIVSLAQAMYSGQSFHDFIDNPFSPGFAAILKIFSIIHGGVSWNVFVNGAIIYSSIFIIIASFYHLNSETSNKIIFYAFLFAAVLPLMTDGFIYLHDASNVMAAFSTFLLYIIISNKNYYKMTSPSIILLAFILSFLLLMRANTGVGFAVMNSLLLISWITFDFKINLFQRLKLILIWILYLLVFSYTTISLVSNFIVLDINKYIYDLLAIGSERSAIHGFINTGILTFNLFDLSGFRLKEYSVYFIELLLILVLSLELTASKLLNRAVPSWFLSLFALFFLLIARNWELVPILFLLIAIIFFLMPFIKNREAFQFINDITMHKLIFFGWGFFGILLSFIIMLQSFDPRSTTFGILILSIVIAFISNNSFDAKSIKIITPWMLIIVISLSFEGIYRFKLITAGPPIDRNDFTATLNDSFFNNHKTSQYHYRYEKSIESFFNDNEKNLKNKKILFLSRIEYLYAKYDIPPPSGVPLWWHLGTSYRKVSSDSIIDTIKNDVDYIIGLSDHQGNPDAGMMANDDIYNVINDGTFFEKNLDYAEVVVLKNKIIK